MYKAKLTTAESHAIMRLYTTITGDKITEMDQLIKVHTAIQKYIKDSTPVIDPPINQTKLL